MNNRILFILRIAVHAAAWVLLALLIWDFTQNQLTANPIREIQDRTGIYAIDFLMLSLACTPVYIVSGWNKVLLLRRPLGLYAFMWVCLHFFNFVGLDYGFNLTYLSQDIFQKPYIIVGLAAFILLIPLAVTATRGWVNRMGFGRWKRLQRLVYIIAILAVIHYIWQVKAHPVTPYVYGAVLFVLLLIRLPPIANLFRKLLAHRS
jgi:sulfoxide reductase heme-binding subunit YedZ